MLTEIDALSVLVCTVPLIACFIAVQIRAAGWVLANQVAMDVGLFAAYTGLVLMLASEANPDGIWLALAIVVLPVLYMLLLKAALSGWVLTLSEPDALPGSLPFRIGAAVLCLVLFCALASYKATIDVFLSWPALAWVGLPVLLGGVGLRAAGQLRLGMVLRLLPIAGLIGALVGLVGALRNMADVVAMGPELALGLLAMMYSYGARVLLLLLFPHATEGYRALNQDLVVLILGTGVACSYLGLLMHATGMA